MTLLCDVLMVENDCQACGNQSDLRYPNYATG